MAIPAQSTTIRIDRHTADQLLSQARCHGLSLEDYLRRIALQEVPPEDAGDQMSLEATDRWLDELARSAARSPSLPADFSRNDIYSDHD